MSTIPTRPLALVRNEAVDSLGIAPGCFQEAGLPIRIVEAWEGQPLPSPAEISGLACFGGTMNVDQVRRYPYLAEERLVIREAVKARVPFLGICLGSQLLARALDQPVYRLPGRRLGFSPVKPTEAGRADPVAAGFAPGSAFHWNEDAFDLPPKATLLATGPSGEPEAFRVGPSAWGVVFHPEVTEIELKTWMDQTEELPGRWGRPRDELEAEIEQRLPEHEERGARLLAGFARFVLAGPG